METNVMAERRRFVTEFATGAWSMAELCERYGISRPTGYKWVARYAATGDEGLRDRSRAPHHSPHETPGAMVQQILSAEAVWLGRRQVARAAQGATPGAGVARAEYVQ